MDNIHELKSNYMVNYDLNTESKILEVANNVFLLYGYHGTKVNQIAVEAGVHQSTIHYYFRTKERLYIKVVESALNIFLNTGSKFEQHRWFFFTELYNNQNLFKTTLQKLYLNEWDDKLNELKKLLEIN